MKRIWKLSLVAAAVVALTIHVVGKQSSMSENPLLSANVEALSASEVVAPGVIDAGNGTIMFMNATNVTDNKARTLNCCESHPGGVCLIKTDCNVKGRTKVDLIGFLKQIFTKENMETLLKILKQWKGL